MKAQFDHIVLSSFYLWFESHLLSTKVQAYNTNLPNNFKAITAYDVPTGYIAYQGEFRQLVADTGIPNFNSGFYVNGSFVSANTSTSNIFVDYDNGRLIVPQASGAALPISGSFAVKEVNTYITNEDEEQLLLHGDFIENGQSYPYFYNNTEKLDEKAYFLPACFISLANADNAAFSLGGEEETKTRIKVTVLTKDNYTLDAVLSAFRDTARETIVHVPYEQFPYGAFFSLKSYPYSYSQLVSGQPYLTSNRSFISDVTVSKIVNETVRQKINKNVLIGFLDFELSTYRFPRL